MKKKKELRKLLKEAIAKRLMEKKMEESGNATPMSNITEKLKSKGLQ